MRLSCPVAALLLVGLSVCLAVQNPSSSPLDYPDSRIVDAKNKFANVGALITMAEKNDAGVPEGPLGFCTGTLIEERVLLTAGHCVCPGLPSPCPEKCAMGIPADRYSSTVLPVMIQSLWARFHTRANAEPQACMRASIPMRCKAGSLKPSRQT
jgi:hypothetical protein